MEYSSNQANSLISGQTYSYSGTGHQLKTQSHGQAGSGTAQVGLSLPPYPGYQNQVKEYHNSKKRTRDGNLFRIINIFVAISNSDSNSSSTNFDADMGSGQAICRPLMKRLCTNKDGEMRSRQQALEDMHSTSESIGAHSVRCVSPPQNHYNSLNLQSLHISLQNLSTQDAPMSHPGHPIIKKEELLSKQKEIYRK